MTGTCLENRIPDSTLEKRFKALQNVCVHIFDSRVFELQKDVITLTHGKLQSVQESAKRKNMLVEMFTTCAVRPEAVSF